MPWAGSSWRRASPLSDKEDANVILTASTQASEVLAELGYTNVKEFGGIIDWPYNVEQ